MLDFEAGIPFIFIIKVYMKINLLIGGRGKARSCFPPLKCSVVCVSAIVRHFWSFWGAAGFRGNPN